MQFIICRFSRSFHGFTAQKESTPFGFNPSTQTFLGLTVARGDIDMVYTGSNNQLHCFISLFLGYFIKSGSTEYCNGTLMICPTQSSCLYISSWILLILEESSLTGKVSAKKIILLPHRLSSLLQ